MLRDAIWLLLKYPDSQYDGEPSLLSAVARTHGNVSVSDYDHFRDAILGAVTERDSKKAADAWSATMAPGFKYLKGKLLPAAAPASAADAAQRVPPQAEPL